MSVQPSTPLPPSPRNPSSIQIMFGKISKKYDLANSILSFGIHWLWKKKLVRESLVQPGHTVLDCATGTGDLAFLFESKVKKKGKVIGTDFCEPMLSEARSKALQRSSQVTFEWGDVQNLEYSNGSFDIASISFGIRNVQDTQKALFELGRVVKKGGKVLILEFGQPQNRIIRYLYQFYSEKMLPWIGGYLSGQPEAYRYLQTSSSQFPCAKNFLALAAKTGRFSKMHFIPFQSGIAYLYILEVSENAKS